MYTDQLETAELSVERIYLDPNNPRFWDKSNTRECPDRRIADEKIQAAVASKIRSHGIKELRDSILRNGFLSLDRIVVRRILNTENYVIVEGNRRFAALSMLREEIESDTVGEDEISEDDLEKLYHDTEALEVLVYRGDETHDISWLLQGIRHISGIRAWSPAQRARLVAEQVDNKGMRFRAAGQTFGLTAQAVGRLYRSYKALEQMKTDDEFSGKALNEYFTLFEEAIRNRTVRDWLDWNHDEFRFENEDNLKQFYSWISPDDEHEQQARRIHDPRQIKMLAGLINGQHSELLEQIDQHEISIDQAHAATSDMDRSSEWRPRLEKIRKLIAGLPQQAMFEDTDDFLEALEEIERQICLRKRAIIRMKEE